MPFAAAAEAAPAVAQFFRFPGAGGLARRDVGPDRGAAAGLQEDAQGRIAAAIQNLHGINVLDLVGHGAGPLSGAEKSGDGC
jgi:hypothetical protein